LLKITVEVDAAQLGKLALGAEETRIAEEAGARGRAVDKIHSALA
jgi:hypothetical protein